MKTIYIQNNDCRTIRYNILIDNYKEYLKKVGEIIRETYGNHIINQQDFSLSKDNRKIYPHPLSDTIINEIEIFSSKGLTRSYLFYGPPGTGKTNLALDIAKKFGSLTVIDVKKLVKPRRAFKANIITTSWL